MGYDAASREVPLKYWGERADMGSRYQAAISLLLGTLQVSEKVKDLLRSCWTLRRQDRPPMTEVFERLKAVVEDMET